MATVKMMQGDSFLVYISLSQGNTVITPDIAEDVEVCVGEEIRKLYSAGEVLFDNESNRYAIRLTQEETLTMQEGSYTVIARIKYRSQPANVRGMNVGNIMIIDGHSEEVI